MPQGDWPDYLDRSGEAKEGVVDHLARMRHIGGVKKIADMK
jgi:hypothetical protein